MSQYHVYAIGNALVDIEYHSDEQRLKEFGIEKGVMTLIDEDRQNLLMTHLDDSHEKMACGGSAANTIIALSDFGGRAYFSCRVANDDSGQIFIDGLSQSNVKSNAAEHRLKDDITGKCLVFVTPDADRTMNTYLGASAKLDASVVDETAIKASDYVYLEGYLVTSEGTKGAAIKCREVAEKHQVKTALTLSDPAIVQHFKEGMLDMIGGGVDLLFANEDEVMQLTQAETFVQAINAIKYYCKSFAVTRGAKGALVFDGEQETDIAPFAVKAIDTLGAGDSFAGAFLYGLTHNMSFAQAGKLASMTSSRIVTQYGPRLSKQEINRILDQYNAGN